MTPPRELNAGRLTPVKLPSGKTVYELAYWCDELRRERKKRLGSNKARAQKEQARIIRERDLRLSGMGTAVGREKLWRDLLPEYVASMEARGLTRKSITGSAADVKRVLEGIGAFQIKDITIRKVTRWRDSLAETRAPRTANRIAGSVATFLSWCASQEIIDRNPLADMKRLREKPARPPRSLTEPELVRLMDALDRLDAEAADWRAAKVTVEGGTKGPGYAGKERVTPFPRGLTARMLLMIGARWSTARQLTWADVHLDLAELRVRPEIVKTRVGRTLPITEPLRELLLACREAATRTTGRIPRGADTVLLTPLGMPWGEQGLSNFRRWLYRAYEDARIPRIDEHGERLHVHALRHTWATRMARKGVPIQETKVLGGWKTLEVLSRIYTHLSADDTRGAMETVTLPDAVQRRETRDIPETSPSEALARELGRARQLLESHGFRVGAPARIRTWDRRIRRLILGFDADSAPSRHSGTGGDK